MCTIKYHSPIQKNSDTIFCEWKSSCTKKYILHYFTQMKFSNIKLTHVEKSQIGFASGRGGGKWKG